MDLGEQMRLLLHSVLLLLLLYKLMNFIQKTIYFKILIKLPIYQTNGNNILLATIVLSVLFTTNENKFCVKKFYKFFSYMEVNIEKCVFSSIDFTPLRMGFLKQLFFNIKLSHF